MATEWGTRSRVCTELLIQFPTRMRTSYLKIPGASRSTQCPQCQQGIRDGALYRRRSESTQSSAAPTHDGAHPKPSTAASLRRSHGGLQSCFLFATVGIPILRSRRPYRYSLRQQGLLSCISDGQARRREMHLNAMATSTETL